MMSLLYLLLLLQFCYSTADPLFQSCGGTNYTSNSTYQSNLNVVLTSLSTSNSTFSTNTTGSIPDRIYGLILCRGDVGSDDCSTCLKNAGQDVLSLCPYSKEATVWYDNCELRYSNTHFFSSVDNTKDGILINTANATDQASFSKLEAELLNNLTHQAAYNSSLKFATGIAVNRSNLPTIYGLVQCTRDLSTDGCNDCLQQILKEYSGYEGRIGGRVLGTSCTFRYEVYSFYKGKPTISLNASTPPVSPTPPSVPPPPPVSSTPTPTGKGSKNTTTLVLSIVIPIVVILLIFFGICICIWRKRSAKKIPSIATLEEMSSSESLLIDLSILKEATDNFSEVNKLGQGGFGAVYKGTLSDGQEIAVKRLSTSSTQGLEELKNELFLVAKLQHKNLVRLRGVCLEEEEKLLVYEYVPNRSLDNFLFDPINRQQLNWEQRFNIIGGIARGLFYLHEESHLKVIHRDLKASNILLGADMTPKISDFGLARLFGADETQGMTSRIFGTFGYMAPEYAMHGQFSTKVDVFSFGVLVLEIVTGRKCSSFYDSEHPQDFLSYAWEYWSNGTILEIMDPSLGENCSRNEVLRCIHVALLCVQEVPADRPLMSSVVLMLHSPSVPLQAPSQPILLARMGSAVNSNVSGKQSDLSSTDGLTSKSQPISVNEVSITDLQPR